MGCCTLSFILGVLVMAIIAGMIVRK